MNYGVEQVDFPKEIRMTNNFELAMMEGCSVPSVPPPNQPSENVLECDPFVMEQKVEHKLIRLKDRTDLTEEQKTAIMNSEPSTDAS